MIRVYNSENGCVHVGFIDWWGLAHADEPFPLPCPLVNPLHRRIRRPHPDPLPSLPPSFLSSPPLPVPYAPLLSAVHTHSAFFFPPPPPSPPWIWVSWLWLGLNFPEPPTWPNPPTLLCYHRGLGVPLDSVCVWWPLPPDSVTWHTERLHCWTSRFAWNAGFASHSCGREL